MKKKKISEYMREKYKDIIKETLQDMEKPRKKIHHEDRDFQQIFFDQNDPDFVDVGSLNSKESVFIEIN